MTYSAAVVKKEDNISNAENLLQLMKQNYYRNIIIIGIPINIIGILLIMGIVALPDIRLH